MSWVILEIVVVPLTTYANDRGEVMFPSSEFASTILALRWLVAQVKTCGSRHQVKAYLKILRRYAFDDHKALQEVGERIYSLDEMAAGISGRRSLSVSERRAIARWLCMERAGYRCAISGKMIGMCGQVHHGVPLRYGGGWEQENLFYLDATFQMYIHDKRFERPDGVTDREWQKVLGFRALIEEARQQWQQGRWSRQEATA